MENLDLTVSPLLDILSNPLILSQTVQSLPVHALFNLAATSKSFKNLIYHTPQVFRRLDLSPYKAAQVKASGIDHGGNTWRNVQLDENLTEDEFYGGPLRGILSDFRKRNILENVQILVLDGLSVTFELVNEIITEPMYNVQLLSIREVTNLNERKLMQALEYAVRPTRAENSPRLKGLYIFGPKDCPPLKAKSLLTKTREDLLATGVMSSQGAQIGAEWNHRSEDALAQELSFDGDRWYRSSGRVLRKDPMEGWARTIEICQEVIAFDAVLCRGPRHQFSACVDAEGPWYRAPDVHLRPSIAHLALTPCTGCDKVPEGLADYLEAPDIALPLLAPPPFYSSSVRAARRPTPNQLGQFPPLVARCTDCMRHRYCSNCRKWWCENCYEGADRVFRGASGPSREEITASDLNPAAQVKVGVALECWDCGRNCGSCIAQTQQNCKLCGGGYCLLHNTGSTASTAGRHAINACRC